VEISKLSIVHVSVIRAISLDTLPIINGTFKKSPLASMSFAGSVRNAYGSFGPLINSSIVGEI
jgi:hypothetical protein